MTLDGYWPPPKHFKQERGTVRYVVRAPWFSEETGLVTGMAR